MTMLVVCMGEKVIAWKMLLGKSKGKRELELSKSRWKNDMNMGLKEML
jgi:hypothetical protein